MYIGTVMRERLTLKNVLSYTTSLLTLDLSAGLQLVKVKNIMFEPDRLVPDVATRCSTAHFASIIFRSQECHNDDLRFDELKRCYGS